MYCEQTYVKNCVDLLMKVYGETDIDNVDLKSIINDYIIETTEYDLDSDDLKTIVDLYYTFDEDYGENIDDITDEIYKNIAFDILEYEIAPKILDEFLEMRKSS